MEIIKNMKKILLTVALIIIILIAIYRIYSASYNNQFLKHIQYISEIKSMGKETTDLQSLIQAVIDNNKKSSKKVTVRCVIESERYSPERAQKDYTTVQELEWLLGKLESSASSINLEYDRKTSLIKCIEIRVPKDEEFWEYISGFAKDEAKLTEIKDFIEKAREKQKELIVEEKPVNVVYTVDSQEKMSVDSLKEEDVNKILEQLSEENTYRLLIQTYNDFYKVNIMYYTR